MDRKRGRGRRRGRRRGRLKPTSTLCVKTSFAGHILPRACIDSDFPRSFPCFSNRVRVSLLTLRILLMFGKKKGHDLFHNLFSRLYWMATFSQPKTDKIKHIYKAFGQHKNLPNKHKNSARIKQLKKIQQKVYSTHKNSLKI